MVPSSPSVLLQITLVPTGTVRILGLNSLLGTLTKASLATCTVGGVAGVAGVVGAVGVVGGVAGAGLAQALRINNTPPSKVAIIIRVLRILKPPGPG